MGIDSLSCQGWHKASLPFQQVKTQLLRCTLAQLVKLLFQWVGLRVSIRSWTQRYLNSGCKSADDADAQFGYVRTLDREAGVMGKWTHLGPQLWEKKEKQCGCLPACHCPSSILQHSFHLCWPLPAHIHPLLLGYPLLTLCTGTGQLHPVLSAGKPWANLDWKVCAKIKAGHKHLSDSTSTSVYLKPKASGVQSMMNYFFVSGLTAHVTSAANPSSI